MEEFADWNWYGKCRWFREIWDFLSTQNAQWWRPCRYPRSRFKSLYNKSMVTSLDPEIRFCYSRMGFIRIRYVTSALILLRHARLPPNLDPKGYFGGIIMLGCRGESGGSPVTSFSTIHSYPCYNASCKYTLPYTLQKKKAWCHIWYS